MRASSNRAAIWMVIVVASGLSLCGLAGAATKAAPCPRGGETAIEHSRSSKVKSGPLAPAGTLWTTVCSSGGSKIAKGGPLDAALNGARSKPDQVCPMIAELPMLVILRYAGSTRQFVLNMGGCPGVVLHDGHQLSFTSAGIQSINALGRGIHS